ncbi:MAG: HD domain-containing protein, partial [Solobacterium sp.]|nr:HD domain-containing protein [Solobacterium sp.]
VIRMCLIHDLGETFTGDIPVFMKTDNNEKTEAQLLKEWVSSFPAETAGKWLALYEEMEKLETREAKLYKALDKLEAVISHNESDISTWLPLEYDLQLTHGRDNVRFSPYMQQLKQAVDAWTLHKIETEKPTDEQTDQPAAGSCPETRDDR